MIDFQNAFCEVFINFLTMKAQNTLMKFTFPLNPVKQIHSISFQRFKQPLRKSSKGLNSPSYRLKGQEAQIASNTM